MLSRRNQTRTDSVGGGRWVVPVTVDVDHIAVRSANQEPGYAPRFGGERVDDLIAASLGLLVGLINAVADVNRDR
jgi:hypothetical protein